MLDASKIGRHQVQKKLCLGVIAVATSFFTICCVLRFNSSLNGKLSGPPQYMRIIADGLAHTVAGATGGESPVILIHNETLDCQWTDTPTAGDPAAFYYVLLYSETYRAFCFVTYVEAFAGTNPTISRTLTPKTGQNYGHLLTGPVTVVPVAHVALRFPESYLSLLHWRAKADPAQIESLAPAQFVRSRSLSFRHDDLNLSLNFIELRAAVGHRHVIVNIVLDTFCLMFLLLVLGSAGRIGFLYFRFREEYSTYCSTLSLASFLRKNLETTMKRSQEDYQRQHQEAMEELRATSLFNRSKETVRKRLEGLLDVLEEEPQQRRVRESLAQSDLENMRSVLQELELHFARKAPEERLTLLLDSVREFCTTEEFETNRAEAFDILAHFDFRQARAFIVRRHDELRNRLKTREDEQIARTPSQAGQ
jgi:hypothetical protein